MRKLQLDGRSVQYVQAAGRFVQDFHAEGPGFELEVTLRMNGK